MNNFELVKEKDEGMNLGAHKWYGTEDRTADELLHDPGKGDTIVLRNFEFQLNPGLKEKPTKQQILTPEYLKHLSTLLWADSLRLITEPEVRITEDKIIICAPCQPRTGAVITEQPKLLQEWIQEVN